MAVALGWTGAVDTDLPFSDFYGTDHTVLIRFLPQYPNAYEGPILSVNGTGGYLIGQATAPQGTDTHRDGQGFLIKIQASTQSVKVVLNAGQWYHLAVVRTGNQVVVYLNGSQVGNKILLTNSQKPSGLLRLGRASPGQIVNLREPQFYGIVADLAVYKRAFTTTELSTHSSSLGSLSGNEPGLYAGWVFTPWVTPLPAALQRHEALTGATTYLLPATGWVGSQDVTRIPLPTHAPMQLPFVAGDAWAVAQGTDASWSHFGYASFCHDFIIASPLSGPPYNTGDTYPKGTMHAPICAAGQGQIEALGDTLPKPPLTTQVDTNQIEVKHGDGLTRGYLHLLKNSIRPKRWQTLSDGEPIGKVSEFPDNAHFHFAVSNLVDPDLDSQAWVPGFVTVPYAFDNYEVRQPNGLWKAVPRGIPQAGEVVRRTGRRLWLVGTAASSYSFLLMPRLSVRLISQLRTRARLTVEVSANGGPFSILRSEDPYPGALPPSLVGIWNGRMLTANTPTVLTLFWLGRTAGAKTYFNVNGRYRFRLSATDEDGYQAESIVVEASIRWHGERVSCVRLQGPPRRPRIIGIGGTDADRGKWTLTTAEAVAALGRGDRLYVENSAGQRADLYVVDRKNGRQYLSTVADAVDTNNLLKLPQCT